MTTTYGIEIECASPVSRDEVARALRAAGLNAITAEYSSRQYDVWQVKADVTIPTNGILRHQVEVVSPVLTWGNDDHVAQIRTVSEILAGLGCKVLPPSSAGSTCGLHVHLSMADLAPHALARWGSIWQARQVDTTDTLVRSGRASGGRYSRWCQVLGASHWDAFRSAAMAGDARRVAAVADGHGFAINTQWFAQRGTLEVRQRDGSTHWQKILGWVAYVMATKLHAAGGEDYAGDMGYLPWLADRGYLTDEHMRWALRHTDAVSAAERVRTGANERLSRLRRLQGIS